MMLLWHWKPILKEPSGIHFNISHSGNWVVCSVDDNSVGIDVELIKPIDFIIAERFFSKDEYMTLKNQSDEMKLKYFYMIWTLKESYIKAEGKGLSIPLNSFVININGNNTNTNANIISVSKKRGYNFFQSFIDDNTLYAICTMSDITHLIINWNIEQFMKKISCV